MPFSRPKFIQNAKTVGGALKNSGYYNLLKLKFSYIPSCFAPARKTPRIDSVEEAFGGRTPPIIDGDLLDPLQDGSKGHRPAPNTSFDNQIDLTTMGNI